jgi:pantoate--beta-alanine ligase
MTPKVVTTRSSLREALGASHPGFVPTMGALHQGHLALISRSAAENVTTVVSIFVNPTQFSNPDDLKRYPRDLDHDVALAADAGATLFFAPAVAEIYPPGFSTRVNVGPLADRWEGVARPGHFHGVATVVTILLNLVQPARSYFGEKDFQQLQIIRQLHRDLALTGSIIGCPTVREPDGLAYSSRNARLSPEARARAAAIPHAIETVLAAAKNGEADSHRLIALARDALAQSGLTIDYVTLVDESTLDPLPTLQPGARLLLAVDAGGTRLIDNAAITI